jgi:hypothetical protein
VKKLLSITPLGVVLMLGCSDQAESPSSGKASTVTVAQSALTATPTHLLIVASYENGVFKAESAKRIPGAFVKPRSGKPRGAVTFLARQGANTLALGGLPDPREVHVDSPEPKTGRMSHVSVQARDKQHFVMHLPDTADAVDFYDVKGAPASIRSAVTSVAAAPNSVATGTPIGTITLQGLL